MLMWLKPYSIGLLVPVYRAGLTCAFVSTMLLSPSAHAECCQRSAERPPGPAGCQAGGGATCAARADSLCGMATAGSQQAITSAAVALTPNTRFIRSSAA